MMMEAVDDGLRIMIYDETDIRGWARALKDAKEYTPGPVDDALDYLVEELDLELGLSTSWWAGGKLFRTLRRLDHMRGFNNWPSALRWIADLEPTRPIKEIQFWGHGSPGKVWILQKAMTALAFKYAPHRDPLMRIKTRLTDESLIWFRTCSTFCGTRGQAFAQTWADNMGCRIAAHTYIIGPFQSGLHSVGPGEKPMWPDTEGIAEGTPDRILKARWSMPWSPNTIFALQSHKPRKW